ncbi:biotin-dependent carboxyltransferase family protein [Haladaptatus salinisoli]|uniref:5-oxoprolinase subunit C family protein n=1 Tax=Haladaptatus salinisoli TaxID=2884876 RepID=UPI001D0BE337|nr:biotin-dependent carboxyltransferase family protein [Haladaptatus salinisoli]
MIEVLEPGISTTVQDLGRYGHYHIGMPPSGAMDQFSHKVANYLVGNDENSATLEITYQGPDLKFEEDAVIAIAGADMEATINDESVSTWETNQIEAGEVLSFNFATEGARSYLAVAGGIDVSLMMDSRSTYTLIGIGGHNGRQLQEGDTLSIGDSGDNSASIGTRVPDEHRPTYSEMDPIRVVMGLCDYRLTDESKAEFLETKWTVTPEADRVGYRLDGIDLEFIEREQPFGAGTDPSNVVDLGYPVGSIQVPEQPIVLMRDAVTGGGYATIGTVISPDRNRLAQHRTHQSFSFEGVMIDEALSARNALTDRLETIRSSVTKENNP